MFPIQVARLVEICYQKGIRQVVVSPGSRSAPLTIGFVRHGGFTVRTISDERSAAYVALGIAQATRQVVALVSTSGTAAINHAPAVAEAFYLQVPLLVLSADRPSEWIDQQDGQTVRQTMLHQFHTKMSAQLPTETHPDSLWFADRLVNELINEALTYPCAPVHLNVPIREPFYPAPEEVIDFRPQLPFPVKIISEEKSRLSLTTTQWQQLADEWQQYPKKLVVVGQNWQEDLSPYLTLLDVPIVADVISNYVGINAINHHDLFSFCEELRPDLLITLGLSVLSKKLKLFLRTFKPKAHWHIAPSGKVADTYQSLTKVIRLHPTDFFKEIASKDFQTSLAYRQAWQKAEQEAIEKIDEWKQKLPFGELSAVA
ncbi:MAG: 2-succinyl-5-enolpyruvyl-6-hydroxy-3-cyclohexene-1-carboxylic-acid synthase, partial [Flammeovirgaceae bacterium]|nr:2-succinyl-5-enolpyruvyl-6-hydroxy-3-cyclohexene-1-carboxylic-acid synthase [Flammeovirgaceae bacterium]